MGAACLRFYSGDNLNLIRIVRPTNGATQTVKHCAPVVHQKSIGVWIVNRQLIERLAWIVNISCDPGFLTPPNIFRWNNLHFHDQPLQIYSNWNCEHISSKLTLWSGNPKLAVASYKFENETFVANTYIGIGIQFSIFFGRNAQNPKKWVVDL